MEFLRSFLRRHLARKPVEASPNVGRVLRLVWTGPQCQYLFQQFLIEANYRYFSLKTVTVFFRIRLDGKLMRKKIKVK